MQSMESVLQSSLAPAFLLLALSGILGLYSGRLGRIVDRTRLLEKQVELGMGQGLVGKTHELKLLKMRIEVVRKSILLGVVSAIWVCVVIGSLFVMGISDIPLGLPIAISFLISLFLFGVSLIFFIQEVRLSTQCLNNILR